MVEQPVLQIEHIKTTKTFEHSPQHNMQSVQNDIYSCATSYISYSSYCTHHRETLLLIIDQTSQITQKFRSSLTHKTKPQNDPPKTQGQQHTLEIKNSTLETTTNTENSIYIESLLNTQRRPQLRPALEPEVQKRTKNDTDPTRTQKR